MKRDKVKLYIEHADGYHETVKVTTPIATVLTHRLLELGHPFCSVTIDGIRLKEPGHAFNVFNGYYGEQVIL